MSKTAGSLNLLICQHQPISLEGKRAAQPRGLGAEGGMVAGTQAPTCHSDVILHEPDVVLGLWGEVLPLPGARGVRLPPRQCFILDLNLLQYLLVRWGDRGWGVTCVPKMLVLGSPIRGPACCNSAGGRARGPVWFCQRWGGGEWFLDIGCTPSRPGDTSSLDMEFLRALLARSQVTQPRNSVDPVWKFFLSFFF